MCIGHCSHEAAKAVMCIGLLYSLGCQGKIPEGFPKLF